MADDITPRPSRGRLPSGLDTTLPVAAAATELPAITTSTPVPHVAAAAGRQTGKSSTGSLTGYFDEIKRRVSLETYLEEIGVALVPAGSMLVACCPFHEEDTASFQVVDGKSGQSWQTWTCRGACDTGGTVVDAVMMREGLSALDAAEWLNDHYELGIERDEKWAEQRRVFKERVERYTKVSDEGRAEYTQGETKVAQQVRAYLEGRGFTPETIEHFQLGAADRRVQIPLIDSGNAIVATDGRALFDGAKCRACDEYVSSRAMFDLRNAFTHAKEGETPEPWEHCPHCNAPDRQSRVAWLASQYPKYKFPKGFKKDVFLFNFHDARRQLVDHKNAGKLFGLFLTEGYMDTFAVWQAAQSGVCAYNGKKISVWQAEKICELARKLSIPVVLIPDFDATGRKFVRRNIEVLRAVDPDVEIQVLFSIDQLPTDKAGEVCKDAADVQRYHGSDTLARLLLNDRRPAEEWLIREVVDQPITLISVSKQIELVSEILASVRHRISLSHMIPYLANAWGFDEQAVSGWFGSAVPGMAAQHEHLFKTIGQARDEAVEWRQHADLIRWGYDEIDEAVGGGFRRGWINLLIAKSGAGKSAIACQLVAHWAEMGFRVIFFSLEMQAAQLFERMICQVLDIDSKAAVKLVEENSPELDRVVDLYHNLYIIDNVPRTDKVAVSMTPAAVETIIREANLTKFRDHPTDIVVIDHLGIVACPEDAPRNVLNDELQAEGLKVQKLFDVTKRCNVYTLILQQVSKVIKPGMPFEAGDGRGGSKQLDFCDQVICAWRPEHEAGIEESERLSRRGLIVVALMKNRYGRDYLKLDMTFDPSTLKILANWESTMPIDDWNEAGNAAVATEQRQLPPGESGAELWGEEPPAAASELDAFLGAGVDDDGALQL